MATEESLWLDDYLQLLAERNPGLVELRGAAPAPIKLAEAASFFEVRRYQPGDVLVSQDSHSRRLLLIVEGRARAHEKPREEGGRLGDAEPIGTLEAPDVVGEVALVMQTPRLATVVAATEIRALRIDHHQLQRCMAADPVFGTMLLRWFAEDAVLKIRNTAWFREVLRGERPADVAAGLEPEGTRLQRTAVDTSPARLADRLAGLPCFLWNRSHVTEAIAAHFGVCRFGAGETLLVAGQPGDALMLLGEGRAEALDARGERVVGFAAGEARPAQVLIGEMGFLHPGERNATVVARDTCELLVLPRAAVPALVQQAPWFAILLHIGILQAVCRRLIETTNAQAHYRELLGGEVDRWFVDDDHYARRFVAS